MAKAKSNGRLHKNKRRIGITVRNWRDIDTFEELKTERDRYLTERQILYDQSNDWRIFLANKYLRGSGIEIGPAEHPLVVPHWAEIKYVDEISTEDLIKRYPYLKKHDLVNIDVVDDGQELRKFKDNSQDFIIANHFLEHVIDPIKTIKTFYRVLKPEGILYMAVPDKRYTFDRLRPNTPLGRLKEYYNNPKKADQGKWPMFLEAAKLTEGKSGAGINRYAQKLFDEQFSIHLNVWTQQALLELLLYVIGTYKLIFDFETIVKNEHEVICILRKQPRNTSKVTPGVKKARRLYGTNA